MSNLIAIPARWADSYSHSPPSWWNGAAFVISGVSSTGAGPIMTATAAAGDTLSFTFANLVADTSDGATPEVQVLQNSTAIWTQALNAVVAPTSVMLGPFNASDSIEFLASSGVSELYHCDFTITPPPPPIAPSESLSMNGYLAPATAPTVSVTPVITQAGNPVSGATFAIMAQPGHGTVTISAGVLVYTPNQAFFGTDTYTYTATYNGQVSNVATVTVVITQACTGPIFEIWPAPDQTYNLRIRAYPQTQTFGYPITSPSDSVNTFCDARLVLLMALANAKAHYEHNDAQVYQQELKSMLGKLRANRHGNHRYIPQKDAVVTDDFGYPVIPTPVWVR